MERKCLCCGNILFGNQRKYCSKKCQDAIWYRNHKETYIEHSKEWSRRNPKRSKEIAKKATLKFIKNKSKRFKELMRQNYLRNKYKYLSRGTTQRYKHEIFKQKGKICNVCGSVDNIQIHHIDYSWDRKDKRENGKLLILNLDNVEILCRGCHLKKHKG